MFRGNHNPEKCCVRIIIPNALLFANTRLTIVSDCKIADLKSEAADGVPKSALIALAPLLWPARVILDGLPPNEGRTVRKNLSAVTVSLSPRLV